MDKNFQSFRRLFTLSLLGLGLMIWGYQARAEPKADCSSFGNLQSGEPLPYINEDQLRVIFQAACNNFTSVIGSPVNDVHWWEGLLVQDFDGANGNDDGAIFYDVNLNQGGGQAYVL
jgi:hypothetical protein